MWDANEEPNILGYRIYWGTAPGEYSSTLDVGNVTEFTVDGLDYGTYYFAVTAYNDLDLESGFSNELSVDFIFDDFRSSYDGDRKIDTDYLTLDEVPLDSAVTSGFPFGCGGDSVLYLPDLAADGLWDCRVALWNLDQNWGVVSVQSFSADGIGLGPPWEQMIAPGERLVIRGPFRSISDPLTGLQGYMQIISRGVAVAGGILYSRSPDIRAPWEISPDVRPPPHKIR